MTKNRSIFVNLPVKDLDRSIEFFTSLGFEFNPEFTNEVAACMIISENIFNMLVIESFFNGHTGQAATSVDAERNEDGMR